MITSISNKQIKNIIQLQKKSRTRRDQHCYVVEGWKMVQEASTEELQEVYVSEHFLTQPEYRLKLEAMEQQWNHTVHVEEVSDAVMKSMSDTVTPQGILAVVAMKDYALQELLGDDRKVPHLLLLEGVQDPGNLGTMFRTGEGAGITGIIMSRETVDIYHPKTIRSTMGSIYRIPFLITEDLTATIAELKNHGVHLYAAHLKGTQNYDQYDYTQGTGFLIGNEGNGLTDETAALADTYIRIPMGGQLESLNAAMAAGILMYETNRQRRWQ